MCWPRKTRPNLRRCLDAPQRARRNQVDMAMSISVAYCVSILQNQHRPCHLVAYCNRSINLYSPMQLQANNKKSVAVCQNRQQPNKAGHLRQTDDSTHYNTEKEKMKSRSTILLHNRNWEIIQ